MCPNDGARLVRFKSQRDPMIGRVLDGRFEVRAPLGTGGMGTVYRAWQLSVDREVAVKVVHAKLANDRTAAKRFLREARLASRLSQPNIVNVHEFGQTEDGVLYLVMELLRGETLAQLLERERGMPLKRATSILLQLCDALDAAHSMGIVHRDLKPGNIVLLEGPAGREPVKVLDFGLAKSLVSDSTTHITQTDAILGTPLYMPPEAVQAKPMDQRGDIYSLGCIFYELLAGAPPFFDPSVNVVLSMHLSSPPPMLPEHVPMAVAELILTMMAKRPEQRPQTAADVRAHLQAVMERELARSASSYAPMQTIPPERSGAIGPLAVALTAPASDNDNSHGDLALSRMITSRSRNDPPARPSKRGFVIGFVLAVGVVAGSFALVRALGSNAASPARSQVSDAQLAVPAVMRSVDAVMPPQVTVMPITPVSPVPVDAAAPTGPEVAPAPHVPRWHPTHPLHVAKPAPPPPAPAPTTNPPATAPPAKPPNKLDFYPTGP
jgi:serine/threonine protein kinase